MAYFLHMHHEKKNKKLFQKKAENRILKFPKFRDFLNKIAPLYLLKLEWLTAINYPNFTSILNEFFCLKKYLVSYFRLLEFINIGVKNGWWKWIYTIIGDTKNQHNYHAKNTKYFEWIKQKFEQHRVHLPTMIACHLFYSGKQEKCYGCSRNIFLSIKKVV